MPGTRTAARRSIRIRMYRVGFGDCFLVSFPEPGGARHVLVDCGVHQKGDIRTLKRIVDQIATDSGGALAIVVATHEHQDHLAGFGTYAGTFRQLRVGEVWMPWTSNLEDPQAAELRRKHLALLARLQAHFRGAAAPEDVRYILLNLASNRAALDLLRGGFDGKASVRYLEAGSSVRKPAGIDGLTVQVLAPPRDVSLLGRMEPPASERFLRRPGASMERRGGGRVEPFPRHWRARRPPSALSARERALLRDALLMETLAFTLDSAVNNTSLVLAMMYGGRTLLFAGDAQWGNWHSWLDGADAARILASLSFYKVAHHGSHNATPKSAVAAMPSGGFAAMASTQSTPWSTIPQRKIMDALAQRTRNRVVQSDSLPVPNAPRGPVLARMPRGFRAGELWVDCVIPV